MWSTLLSRNALEIWCGILIWSFAPNRVAPSCTVFALAMSPVCIPSFDDLMFLLCRPRVKKGYMGGRGQGPSQKLVKSNGFYGGSRRNGSEC